MKIEADYIFCPVCKKFTKLEIDNTNPIDLMCEECKLVITTIKRGKECQLK